jgi:hypothetical protein
MLVDGWRVTFFDDVAPSLSAIFCQKRFALLGFESLAHYEQYRARLSDDPDSRANLEAAENSHCILTEERSYFYRIE